MTIEQGFIALGGIVGVISLFMSILSRFSDLRKTIDDGDKAMHTKLSSDVRYIHDRIEFVMQNYARRDDFASHITRLENNIHYIFTQQQEVNRRLDAILSIITNKPVNAN